MNVAIVADVVDTIRQWAVAAVDTLGTDGLLWLAVAVAVVAALVILWLAWRSGRIRKITPRSQKKSSSWSFRGLRRRSREFLSLFSSKTRYEVPMCLLLGGDRKLAERYVATLTRHGSRHRFAGTPKTVDGGVFGWGDKGELYSLPMQLPLAEDDFAEGLRKLADYRPERPADGVVLNLPISVLRDSDEELEAYAESLCVQLQVLQREWAFSLPIYVVVSGLDELEGFSGFLATSAATPHEMFGWSGVLLPSGQSQAQWCGAAIDMIQQRLLELHLMQPLSPAEGSSGDIFMFPLHIDALMHRIRKALMLTFTDSVHYARDEVRGLYFAASADWKRLNDHAGEAAAEGVEPAPSSSTGESAAKPLAFVRELLEKKVFEEDRRGQPLARGLLSKNRALRSVQLGIVAVSIVGFSILGYQAYSLKRQVSELEPALDRMGALAKKGAEQLPYDPQHNDELVGLAKKYVSELPNLQASSLERISMPTSYIYRLDEQLADRMSSGALPSFIFPVMACQMRNRGQELLEVDDHVVAKATVPRVLWLDNAVRFLEHFEKIQRLSIPRSSDGVSSAYNKGGDSERTAAAGGVDPELIVLQVFDDLVQYTLKHDLGEGFYEASDLYRKALLETSYDLEVGGSEQLCKLDIPWSKELSTGVGAHMRKMSAHANEVAVDKNGDEGPHGIVMAQIDRWSKNTYRKSDLPFSVVVNRVAEIRDLGNEKLESFFPNPELSDAEGGEATPCRRFRERLGAIEETVAGTAAVELLRTVEHQVSEQKCDLELRDHMLRLEYPWLGKLFTVQKVEGETETPAKKVIVVNPKLHRLADALLALEGTALAGAVFDDVPSQSVGWGEMISDYAGTPVGAEGEVFVWDVPQLKKALRYHADYREFERECAECEGDVRGLMRSLAIQAIDNAVVTAQMPLRDLPKTLTFVSARREGALAQRVDAIRPALDVLVELRGVYGRLSDETDAPGQSAPRVKFGNIAHLYVMSQLRELTRLATKDSRLYQPTPTPDWSRPHAAAALFGLSDQASVDEYLTSQLNRVQYLASEYADPLLVYLGTGEAAGEFTGGGDVILWRETLVQLDKFRREDPTNTADQLATLFTERLLAEGEERCKADTSVRAPAGGVDIFSKAYADLWRATSGHCRGEATVEEQTAYEDLALAFNEKLAWHYPFVTSAKQTKREVDPANVVAFFREHPIAGTDLIASVERSGASENKKKAVLRFLRGLADVEAMVNRTLLPPKGSPSGVVLDTEFRANREHSKLAKHILHWRWKVGDTDVEYPRVGDSASVRWEAGMPVSLTLQWAVGSEVRPVKVHRCKRTRGRVKDHNGTYSVGGKWALLRFLDCYRTDRGDLDTALLGFDTRMAHLHVAREADARVFLRIRFMGVDPDTKEPVPVVIPERFPAFAPSL